MNSDALLSVLLSPSSHREDERIYEIIEDRRYEGRKGMLLSNSLLLRGTVPLSYVDFVFI